jgi:hypothetical protein
MRDLALVKKLDKGGRGIIIAQLLARNSSSGIIDIL